MPMGQSDRCNFSIESPFSWVTMVCVKLAKTQPIQTNSPPTLHMGIDLHKIEQINYVTSQVMIKKSEGLRLCILFGWWLSLW